MGLYIELPEIFGDSIVVGEVPVMHKGLIHADERVGPSRMPHPAFGWVALVRDPPVGFEIFKLIILGHLLGVPYDLEDHDITAVGQHKRLFVDQRRIVFLIQAERVLRDELILSFTNIHGAQFVFRDKTVQLRRFNPDKIPHHVRRFDLEAFHLAEIGKVGHLRRRMNVEKRRDEFGFDSLAQRGI